MEFKDKHKVEGYFEFFLIVLFLLIFFFLIRSYILSLLLAASLVFLFYPVYKRVLDKVKIKEIAASIVLVLVIFVILVPIFFATLSILDQTSRLLNSGEDILGTVDLSGCGLQVCSQIEDVLSSFSFELEYLFSRFGDFLVNSSSQIISSVSNLAINLFLFILAVFYLLRDGDKFLRYLKRITPMKSEYKEALFIKFRQATTVVFVNNILIALVQGSLTGIGFWIFGLENPLFWAIIASLLAIIPYVGPSIVWVPGSIYLLLSQNMFGGIGLIIYGLVIVSLADNVLRPILIGERIKIHPLLIFLSIFGGMELFGFFMGIFLGPILVSFLIALLDIYKLDFDT